MRPDPPVTLSNRRHVNIDPAPELAEAVTVTRFWKLVTQGAPDECWEWTGDTDDGYGVFFYHGRMRPAHELSLSFSTGEKRLESLDTCHSCDNPPCVNPAHLRFDTRLSNVRDMWDRGRIESGEAHPHSRISDATVREIRQRRANGARQIDLAEQYGICSAYVSEIVNGLVRQEAGGPITGRSKRTQRSPRSTRRKAA